MNDAIEWARGLVARYGKDGPSTVGHSHETVTANAAKTPKELLHEELAKRGRVWGQVNKDQMTQARVGTMLKSEEDDEPAGNEQEQEQGGTTESVEVDE